MRELQQEVLRLRPGPQGDALSTRRCCPTVKSSAAGFGGVPRPVGRGATLERILEKFFFLEFFDPSKRAFTRGRR